jgi:hypothetical protein
MEQKQFKDISGANKYAENSSRKHEADRYVVKALNCYYVVTDRNDINEGEQVVTHYKNGEKI